MKQSKAKQKSYFNPENGIALCLSGGGFRAMLFHTGALLRLNELGLLYNLSKISSVSGGSITSGYLAFKWKKLKFSKSGVATNLIEEVINPLQEFASVNWLDYRAILYGLFVPKRISKSLVNLYKKLLFGETLLSDLPDKPRFIFNSSNLQSGALWKFSKLAMGDWRVGEIANPKIALAEAVAASSSFPPFLSPFTLSLNNHKFKVTPKGEFANLKEVILTDGGVYDNLGVESALRKDKTLLVSDGGMNFMRKQGISTNWLSQSIRVLETIDHQVRKLRLRQIHELFNTERREGTYWSIFTDKETLRKNIKSIPDLDRLSEVSDIPTRLTKISHQSQINLINWGYLTCCVSLNKEKISSIKLPY